MAWWKPVPFAALAALTFAAPAEAHRASDGFVSLAREGGAVTGQIDFALRDLEWELGLDANGDRVVDWGELRRARAKIEDYVHAHVTLAVGDTPCPLQVTDLLASRHSDGTYAALPFRAACPGLATTPLHVTYSAFFAGDAGHRGLVNVRDGAAQRSDVFAPERRALVFPAPSARAGEAGGLGHFIGEGVRHILSGYDHMLFLLVLLLPMVLVRRGRAWLPATSARGAFLEATKVISAFTLGHSLTLALITLHLWTPPPSRLVESLIAASVLLTAANNLRTVFTRNPWPVAFGFGLIHGMGFASVLVDLGLGMPALAWALVGFNVGVELAQLGLVGLVFPLAFRVRRTLFYRRYCMVTGSSVAAVLAAAWLIERACDVAFLPF